MIQPAAAQEQLVGLEGGCSAAQKPAPVGTAARPRVKPVDRSQLTWQMLDVERLIEPDHPARAIWELVGRVKLDGFYAIEPRITPIPWMRIKRSSRRERRERRIMRKTDFERGKQE